jgi:hypothetical protein
MASIDSYSAQLSVSLLDGVTTSLSTPGSAQSGTVNEAAGGLPHKIAASATDVNVKLGSLTDPVLLALWGDEGVSFKISSGGEAIAAYPFACLADLSNGLGISEIWVSNGVASEQNYTYIAVE